MKIQASSVSVEVAGKVILPPTTTVCPEGQLTALVGPSGSGKTTLLNCLGLLQVPTTGEVLVDGVTTGGWGAAARRRFWRDSAAFVLQDYGVMEEETLGFNVTMAASVLRGRTVGDRGLMRECLSETGLAGREGEPAAHLSGGEKQRLAVARALYKRAQVVFVDEPTASLDAANRTHVIDLFVRLAARGCAVVVATHDDEFMRAADHVVSLGLSEHVVLSEKKGWE